MKIGYNNHPQAFRSGVGPSGSVGKADRPSRGPNPSNDPGAFEAVLQKTLEKEGVRFSRHAVDRMDRRNIRISPEEMNRLNGAINQAAAKGVKESLVILNRHALIVSVENRTVITAMDRSSMQDNLVTNIDSAVLL